MDILMPQLGETVTEGTIISWQCAVGDKVASGDVLFEIETDKTTMEVPATSAGSITEIRVPAGQVVPVGAVVAIIMGDGEVAVETTPANGAVSTVPAPPASLPSAPPVPLPSAPPIVKRELDPFNAVRTPERNFGPAALPNGIRVTPLARRLAEEKGISLATLTGSGPRGRIVASDVREARPPAVDAASSAPVASSAPSALAAGLKGDQVKTLYADAPFVEVEVDGMRRTIARRLVESKQTVPHFYLTADVDIERMLELRRQINEGRSTKISVNDFVVTAYARTLMAFPAANAVWAEDRILRFARVDVGVAVAVEGGLFTPVVRSADSKSLSAIAEEIRDLAERARARKLEPHEYQGGSGSVSNLGMYGVREFAAIISPPQASILAVGAAMRRPVETADGGVAFTSQMTVTLSCDHRVIDGALGAEMLREFKAILEEPLRALL